MNAYFPGLETILAAMIIIASIILVIMKIFQTHTPKTHRTQEPLYTCGNTFPKDELLTAESTFFRTFTTTLHLKTLRKLHTGNLSTYLHWFYLATLIITIAIAVIL